MYLRHIPSCLLRPALFRLFCFADVCPFERSVAGVEGSILNQIDLHKVQGWKMLKMENDKNRFHSRYRNMGNKKNCNFLKIQMKNKNIVEIERR